MKFKTGCIRRDSRAPGFDRGKCKPRTRDSHNVYKGTAYGLNVYLDFPVTPSLFLSSTVGLGPPQIFGQTSTMKGFIAFLLGISASAASCAAATPAAPGLTFLYSLNCTLAAPLPVGAGPHGTRMVIPITGGTFSGPRMSGIQPHTPLVSSNVSKD